MSGLTRRQYLRLNAALATLGFPATRWAAGAPTGGRDGCTLSIGTYSMKGMTLEDAIARVGAIGYQASEIATQPACDGEPAKLPPGRRDEIRKRLDTAGLTLSALMEQITPSPD